ncbi:hypothetical protein SARC_17809, partial [Sphaeroforma arctica JP610]
MPNSHILTRYRANTHAHGLRIQSSVRILNNCELQGIEPFDEALADLREKIKPLASSRDYEWSVDEMTATLHVMAR